MSQSASFWIFGYGSLIWRPGFDFISAHPARLFGAHRSLCIYSHHYRGTPEKPGLVFGLVPGGSCNGMAFEVSGAARPEVMDYLREREQVTNVYCEVERQVRLETGNKVLATTFVVNRHHAQFAGRLSDKEQLTLVRKGVGEAGSNKDYVLNTVEHLTRVQITDNYLTRLAGALTNPETDK